MEGLSKSTDSFVYINDSSSAHLLKDCDLSFQVCDYSRHMGSDPGHLLRRDIKIWADLNRKPRLIVDTAYINNKRMNPADLNRHYAFSLNGIKGYGESFNENSPPDRWHKLEELGYELKPCRSALKGRVLILGQPLRGISTQHINVQNWFQDMVDKLTKTGIPSSEIVFKPHPNQNFPMLGVTVLDRPMDEILQEDFRFVVAKTTNGGVDAALSGLQVYTDDEGSMIKELSVSDDFILHHPERYNAMRNQWINNLAYAQWHIEEVRSGLCWQHFKTNLESSNGYA